jgi:putative transposase
MEERPFTPTTANAAEPPPRIPWKSGPSGPRPPHPMKPLGPVVRQTAQPDVTHLTSFTPPTDYSPSMDRTFFITSVTAQRRTLFQRHETADLLVNVFLTYRDHGKYLLHEFVIMPDHFHALLTPAPEISLERAVQFIKGGFSFRLKSTLPVWQASFTNHRIRDEEDFSRHRQYILMNPVRAGLAAKAEDYPYSSATGHFTLNAALQPCKSGRARLYPRQSENQTRRL